MSLRVQTEIRRSAAEMRSTVWPRLGPLLGGGDLIPVESRSDSELAPMLDMLAMTDAWQIVTDQGIRGLATRVQWAERPWRSWTVRYALPSGRDTEYQRLLRSGVWQQPHYIVQAYVWDGCLLAAAAILTTDLQRMLQAGWHAPPRTNPQDGNLFLPVWWSDAERHGIPIVRVEGKPRTSQLSLWEA